MGEYIDVGIQNSILPLTIILSSLLLGIYALFGVESENDDDDSDSGSGGLMNHPMSLFSSDHMGRTTPKPAVFCLSMNL